jgi:dephospho-CoA kinase
MFVLGLTGSIGMGKSTAAAMFRRLGCQVHDADRTVHELLGRNGAAYAAVAKRFPGAVRPDGEIDRKKLGSLVFGDDAALKDLEAILHPLVRLAETRFLRQARARRERLAVLDIPLLFETGGQNRCDGVAVVTAPLFVQKARVMTRPGMSLEKFGNIHARQMPEQEKMRRADWLLASGLGKRFTYDCIQALVRQLRGF